MYPLYSHFGVTLFKSHGFFLMYFLHCHRITFILPPLLSYPSPRANRCLSRIFLPLKDRGYSLALAPAPPFPPDSPPISIAPPPVPPPLPPFPPNPPRSSHFSWRSTPQTREFFIERYFPSPLPFSPHTSSFRPLKCVAFLFSPPTRSPQPLQNNVSRFIIVLAPPSLQPPCSTPSRGGFFPSPSPLSLLWTFLLFLEGSLPPKLRLRRNSTFHLPFHLWSPQFLFILTRLPPQVFSSLTLCYFLKTLVIFP